MTAIAHDPNTEAPSAAAFFDNLYDTNDALETARRHLRSRLETLTETDPERQDIADLQELLNQAHQMIANATGLAITRLT